MTFSKKHILLSIPGLAFALIGLFSITNDVYTSILMMFWGAMMTPVLWSAIESKFEIETSWKHKLVGFALTLLIITVISPNDKISTNESAQNEVAGNIELSTEIDNQKDTFTQDITTPNESQNNQPESENNNESTNIIDSEETKGNEVSSRVNVLSVVDGDTVKVSINGKSETVRIIGIDTPETVHPSKPVECFGIAASNQAKALLVGKSVDVVIDKSQGERDKYGRLLAYIILPDGRDFGQIMIEGGFAYEYTYIIPYTKQAEYNEAQANASKNQAGLWAPGVCNESEIEVAVPVVTPVESTADNACTIKGNISSDDEKIYHVPGQQHYSKTIIDESAGERWFCTESEAQNAGWRRAMR